MSYLLGHLLIWTIFHNNIKESLHQAFTLRVKYRFIGSRIAVLHPLAWEQNVGHGLALLKSWKKSAKYGYALLIQKRYHNLLSFVNVIWHW